MSAPSMTPNTDPRADAAEGAWTPGPWVNDRGVFIKAALNGVKIATMRLSDGRGKDGRAEREIDAANARLIAAAPELVEALRLGVAVVRGASNEFGAHPAWDGFLMEAGSLLARIEGGVA